jgi:hypothetical protein
MKLGKPIWVLCYLIDSDAWWPNEAPHNPNYFPDVHTYCFDNEAGALAHLKTLKSYSYRLKKTYLQVNHE